MMWKVENGPDGLPVWSGQDSVVNMNREKAVLVKGMALPALVVCDLIALAFFFSPARGLGFVLLLFLVPCSIWFAGLLGALPLRRFFDPAWTLRATASGFEFRRAADPLRPAARWSVSLDDVARVEVGRSSQWEPSRGEGHRRAQTSEHESQAFFFLADGSRRVFASVNASAETVSMLAHSVRSFVDAQRSALSIAAPIADGRSLVPPGIERGVDGRALPPGFSL